MASTMVNIVIMEGIVSRAPEYYNYESGKRRAVFSIACNNGYSGVDFWEIEVWDHNADYLARRNVTKGFLIFVKVGMLKHYHKQRENGSYTDRFYILANAIQILGGKLFEKKTEQNDEVEGIDW